MTEKQTMPDTFVFVNGIEYMHRGQAEEVVQNMDREIEVIKATVSDLDFKAYDLDHAGKPVLWRDKFSDMQDEYNEEHKENENLKARIAELEGVLEFYTNHYDLGEKARAALKGEK